MDTVSKEKRSQIMAQVKSKNSKQEIIVRKFLHAMGFRFTLHNPKLTGKPDIALPKYKTAIFVHGCFWHRHDCRRATMPATNQDYWKKKFERNVERFDQVRIDLENQKWKVLVIWECEITKENILKLSKKINL